MRKKINGFTLIELLLYVSLIGIVVMSTTVFLSILQNQRVKSQVIAEVEDQGVYALRVLTQIIRNSTVINSPAVGVSDTAASFTVPTGSLSPTTATLSGGSIELTEGANAPVSLTTSRVTVSSLSFHNLSRTGTPGTIRIAFTVSYNSSAGTTVYGYSKTFTSDASLR